MPLSMACCISARLSAKATRRGESQFLRRQAPDALAVHGELRGARGRDHLGQSGALDLDQHVSGDGLDLGDDDLRPFPFHQRAQRRAVGHVDDMRAMRDLVTGGVGVAVNRDGLHAQALQGDDHLLAELAGAEQHDARGAGR